MTVRTLDFAAGELFVALQMPLAMLTGEFEFTHASFRFGCAGMMWESLSYCNRREFSFGARVCDPQRFRFINVLRLAEPRSEDFSSRFFHDEHFLTHRFGF